jgi:hypothetical protein
VAGAWPWLAVAGLGALHGLNPATGWMFAAARGLRAQDRAQAWRALVPVAAGHAASVAVVAAVVALGLSVDRVVLQAGAGALLIALVVRHARHVRHVRGRAARARGLASRATPRAGQAAIALWSFVVSTGHGTGLMLVPALIPLCMGSGPAREITASGSLLLALAAVIVHTVAMLGASGLVATAACRLFELGAGFPGRRRHAGASTTHRPDSD